MTPQEKLELLLDRIAEALIVSEYVDTTKVTDSQKFILNGQLQQGGGVGVLALFQKDIKANQEDLINSATVIVDESNVQQNLQEIANNLIPAQYSINVSTEGIISISTESESYNGFDLTPLLTTIDTNEDGTSTVLNPVNVSQFIPLSQQQSNVDIDKANEFLDTNIFELLPTGDTRQARIIRFFQELNALLPPSIDDSDWDSDNDGRVNREPGTDNWEGANQYNQDNSISYAQDNQDGNIDEEDAFIHRLENTANSTNSTKTIESIYKRIVPFLTDILEDAGVETDTRPEYENQSSGYLKFRNLNQGIIIRNTNSEFVEGLNPNNLTFLQPNGGFTITMWVRFIDQVSQGTLFNFGNPFRNINPLGFSLETYVIDGNTKPIRTDGQYLSGFSSDSNMTWKDIFSDNNPSDLDWSGYSGVGVPPSEGFFKDGNVERFVRLVVSDKKQIVDLDPGTEEEIIDSENSRLRGSHIGMPFMSRRAGLPQLGSDDAFTDSGGDTTGSPYDHAYGLMTNTRIPVDFKEWYFICASYNPDVIEPMGPETVLRSEGGIGTPHFSNYWDDYANNKNFWLNHINPLDGSFVSNSTFGNRCKVEIISRTDLLRARGYKV